MSSMDNIIQFPLNNKKQLRTALARAKELFIIAGVSETGAQEAIKELEPLLEPFIEQHQSVMELPSSAALTNEQIRIITEAHNKCVEEIFQHFTEKLGLAVCTIAGLVGSKY